MARKNAISLSSLAQTVLLVFKKTESVTMRRKKLNATMVVEELQVSVTIAVVVFSALTSIASEHPDHDKSYSPPSLYSFL